MASLIILRKKREARESFSLEDAETLYDSEALLERIRRDPSKTPWVAIAPDFKDAGEIAQRIRAVAPSVSVILLAPDAQAAAFPRSTPLADILDETSGASSSASNSAKSDREVLVETQQRLLEAERLASISALTAGIGHDVGTPLAAILGYAELIARSAEDDKNQKRATTIVDQVQRVSDLIETLMNLSRADGHASLPLELGDLLDRTLDFYREKFKRRGVDIVRHFDSAPHVLGDPDRLHQALLSLLLHTLEAMPQGGTLHVSLCETDTADAEIQITDTGTAIPADLEALLLDPRLSTTQAATQATTQATTQVVSGTGLGLLVAKRIVEDHGGEFTVTSEPDSGTQFRLRFPRIAQKAP